MTAFERLCEMRWPEGIRCPYCGHDKVYPVYARTVFTCASKLCRRQFSPYTGTIFSHPKMPAEQYIDAIDAFPNCTGPKDMQAALEVDYRTAHKIYRALQTTGGKLL